MPIAQSNAAESSAIVKMDSAAWELAARSTPDYSFRQSRAYSQELARRRKAIAEFIRIDAGAPIGYASVRVKRLPIPGAGLAFVSFGPLLICGVNSADGPEMFRRCLNALVREYVVNRQVSLRIVPPIIDPGRLPEVDAAFVAAGFQLSTRAPRYRTFVVNLRSSAEVIRRSLEQKWRNQLNSAERRGLAITIDDGHGALDRFAPLFQQIRERKGFNVDLDSEFYGRVQRDSEPGSRLYVVTASDGQADVAGAVVGLSAVTAVYILGATTQAGMKCKAAYALHWTIMMAARDRGCLWYDLGGIDPQENPGVYHFKEGFGGVDITTPGPFELRPKGLAGTLSVAAEVAQVARRMLAGIRAKRTFRSPR